METEVILMPLSTWGLFVLTEIALSLTPGPAVLFVVSQGLRYGGRRSLWANLGILSGNAAYFLLSAFGLGLVLLASRRLFQVVKWCGALYLIYLGGRLILLPGDIATAEETSSASSGWMALWQGFVLQVANPKALVFFVALLPQFIDPAGDIALQVGILAVSSAVAEFLVLAAYGWAAGRLNAWTKTPWVARALDRVAGSMLVGAGISLGLTPIR
jgi:threonine/homoserine/homoserine lactone efflux protein